MSERREDRLRGFVSWARWGASDPSPEQEAQSWGFRPARLAVAGGLLLVVALLVVWFVPRLMYGYVDLEKDRAAAEASTRTGMIAGMAGLAALAGLAFTARTYRITEQGHITDRYTSAIEQLGSEHLDVRLGGIYALERIAVDSARDHPTIVEVLGAYVRLHSQDSPGGRGSFALLGAAGTSGDTHRGTWPPVDVQAALTILGRLPVRPGTPRGDLTGSRLSGATIESGAVLTGVNLSRATLTGARIGKADLSQANLEGVDLSDARLDRTNLAGAKLGQGKLIGARLNEVTLDDAKLPSANFATALFDRVRGRDTNFIHADLSGAKFHTAAFPDANFAGARMPDATFSSRNAPEDVRIRESIFILDGVLEVGPCDLSGATLWHAVLTGADLTGVAVDNASFLFTNLANARVDGINLASVKDLTQEQADSAIGTADTVLPSGLRHPPHWAASSADEVITDPDDGPEHVAERPGDPSTRG